MSIFFCIIYKIQSVLTTNIALVASYKLLANLYSVQWNLIFNASVCIPILSEALLVFNMKAKYLL